MKSWTVLVEAEEYVEVEAETEDEAIENALANAPQFPDWTVTMVLKPRAVEDDQCDIPF